MVPDRFNRRPTTIPPLVTSVISQMNELIELLGAEPELVMSRNFEAHSKLLKRKQKLSSEYRASLKAIAAQPDILKHLPEETHRRLKITAERLMQEAETNGRSLRNAITAVQRLIQNIIAYIKGEVLTTPGYKNPNNAHLELGTYSPTCKPVAVQRTA